MFTLSSGWPVALLTILLILARILSSSLPSFRMSDADPRATPAGWCSMMQVFGSAARLPLAPLARSMPPMALALPKPTHPTSDLMCPMVSRMAMVGTMSPPSVLMYR